MYIFILTPLSFASIKFRSILMTKFQRQNPVLWNIIRSCPLLKIHYRRPIAPYLMAYKNRLPRPPTKTPTRSLSSISYSKCQRSWFKNYWACSVWVFWRFIPRFWRCVYPSWFCVHIYQKDQSVSRRRVGWWTAHTSESSYDTCTWSWSCARGRLKCLPQGDALRPAPNDVMGCGRQ